VLYHQRLADACPLRDGHSRGAALAAGQEQLAGRGQQLSAPLGR
jgi:hypothetical protein